METSLHSPFFSLRIKKGVSALKAELVVVVSKKVATTAVKRNLLKRRARSIFAEIVKSKSARFPSNSVYMIFYKKEGAALSFKESEKEINELFAKADII